jgi:hypothetical protein
MPLWVRAWDFRSWCRRHGCAEDGRLIRFGWWLGKKLGDPDLKELI